MQAAICPDAYVQVGIEQINEGRFRKRLDDAIGKAVAGLVDWESATNRRDGKVTVTAKIKVGRIEDSDDAVSIESQVSTSLPPVNNKSMAAIAGGKMICRLEGTGDDHPDQMKLFDRSGNPTGVLDTATGEVTDETDVAGVLKVVNER